MNDVEICNLALSFVGTAGIQTLEDETPAARACKAFYAAMRDKVLEDRVWSFAKRQYILDPHVDKPLFGFTTKFLVPSEVVRVFRVDDSSGSYRCAWDLQERFILADIERAYVTAVVKVEDVSLYSPGFCVAVGLRLASVLAIPLKENRQLKADLFAEYQLEIKEAAGADGSQGKSEQIRSDYYRRVR